MNDKQTSNPFSAFLKYGHTDEAEVEYHKGMIVEDMLEIMQRNGISRSELADRMGVRPSRITSMLTGTNNFTIDTLVRAARAVGGKLVQRIVDQRSRVVRGFTDTYAPFDVDFSPSQIQLLPPPKLENEADEDSSNAA